MPTFSTTLSFTPATGKWLPAADVQQLLDNTIECVRVIARVTADVTVANTTTPTDIFSQSIAANLLEGNRTLRLTLIGDHLNNSGGNANLTYTVAFGATTLVSSLFSVPSSASRLLSLVNLELMARGTAAQMSHGQLRHAAAAAATNNPAALGADLHNNIASTEDTTASKTLKVTITHGTANVNISYILRSAILELA